MRRLHSTHGYHAEMAEWSADPDLLRTFLAVHRHRNLTRAAEELFVTQPAVSRRIARLERALGVPLLERLGKTIHPTDAGDALAREASALIGSMERLAEAVRTRRSGDRGRIRVGASTTPGLYLLPAVLLRYRERHPDVEVQYSIENSVRIEERLVRNDLDIGFVGASLTRPAVTTRPILADEIVVYASADHALARRHTIAPRDLEGEVWITREPGSATRGLVDAWLRRNRVRLGRTIEIGCPEAAKVLVRSGLGIAYMSRLGLEGEGGVGLSRLRVRGLGLTRPVFLALHGGKRLSSAMQSFLELAVSDDARVSRVTRADRASGEARQS